MEENQCHSHLWWHQSSLLRYAIHQPKDKEKSVLQKANRELLRGRIIGDFVFTSWRTAEESSNVLNINPPLHSSSSLEVLFDLGSIFPIEAFGLLVELGIALVDVVNVSVVIVGPSAAVFSPFLNPIWDMKRRVGRGKSVRVREIKGIFEKEKIFLQRLYSEHL